jgi:hypothetical protein
VRLFDDATDQEIALERGELDVAIFWPGERSIHLRDAPRWRSDLFGTRARGVIAGAWLDGSARDSASSALLLTDLEVMNEQLFRGDLAPLAAAHSPDSAALATPATAIVFRVDASVPGRRALQRFLDRRPPAPGPRSTLVLSYLDAPVPPGAQPALEPGRFPLFAVRCPVVCEPGLRLYVKELGADALVDLLGCEPAAGAR